MNTKFPDITWVEFETILKKLREEKERYLDNENSIAVEKTRNNFKVGKLIVKSHFRYGNNDMVTLRLC